MKTEQKLEVYRELFGSLPIAPDGKELVGFEYRAPREWEIYHFSNMWLENVGGDYTEEDKKVVAIFKDTHRADGTPLSIDPLPEVVGYRVEYFGRGMSDLGGADRFIFMAEGYKNWSKGHAAQPKGDESSHYARLFKIAQPTTLADLVGEDEKSLEYLVGAVKVLLNEIETITKPNI